ncbi:MAG: hypothetical protein KDA29_02565 [Phycisphaerales bacterium]|nr:hypothetical protein [Phycisphaerales bacterium]
MSYEFDPVEDPKAYAGRLIATGYEQEDYVLELVREMLRDEGVADVDDYATRAVSGAIQAQIQSQASWSTPTDCDRLRAAFDSLKEQGILAQHHYSCCGSCGAAEIRIQIDFDESQGTRWRGFTFYHVQDTENAVDGDGIFLNYGDRKGTEEGSIEIANHVCRVLGEHGLETDWDGDLGRRIRVNLEWQNTWPPRKPNRVSQSALDAYQSRIQSENNKQEKKRSWWKRVFGN